MIERAGDDIAAAARKAGVSYATLHDIVSGKTESPRMDTLMKVAKAYGVSVDRFTGNTLTDPPPLGLSEWQPVVREGEVTYGDVDGPASVPGFTMLLPRAREVFEAWYYELVGRKLPLSEVQTLATETLGPISRLGTRYQSGDASDARTEEEQLAVITSNRDFIRRRIP